MSTILFLIGWYILGIIGCILTLEFSKRRDGLDIELGDILLSVVFSFLGLITFLLGIIYFTEWVIKEKINLDFDKVIFKRKVK